MSAVVDLGAPFGRRHIRTLPISGARLRAGDSFLLGDQGPLVSIYQVEPDLTAYGQQIVRDENGTPVTIEPARDYHATRAYRTYSKDCLFPGCGRPVTIELDVVASGFPQSVVCGDCSGDGTDMVITIG